MTTLYIACFIENFQHAFLQYFVLFCADFNHTNIKLFFFTSTIL